PELAPARLLASAYAQADGARRAATEREFVRRLKRLTAEEALRLAGQLPEGSASLLPSVARQVALAVVQDTASMIGGYPARQVSVEPDGPLRITPHRGASRVLDHLDLVGELANLV